MFCKSAIKAGFIGLAFAATTGVALAAPKCGSTSAGFENWVEATKQEAAANGIGKRGIAALNNVHYAQATINADRGQKSFKLSLDQFMKKRGSSTIVARGRVMKKQNAALFDRLEKKYGVASGPVIAIWGMETSFGSYMGKQHTLSAVATLAYDCRRSAFFTDQLYAALKLIDRGDFDPNSIGAMHGEIGQTQFLPKNVLLYGADGDGNGHIDMINSKADALASTFNFLRAHGWQPGQGYQPGEPNFAAIQGWNDASVYQQSIAIMGKQIDGN
ncbi:MULTISPECIES: lytic transglycosylase domain-containing protein [Bartonella]|uniref:lytic murein transglycosylase n=1 Tax=Bartonella TaxID=773 RepID=UPI0018DE1B60|nr:MULTISPECIES: lytic transglycosylase domain-containing protein [Bartonella]MBH9995587.1 lytic murein transglycosylase [Bartonella sp. P0291]MBH9996069.1 lytic murein transglycosylase [Bartonella sp. M0192]MBH9998229.1 lytic murein transglycosylase [Bartonella sp. M0191]MBI0008588.1 lytic murein transglycosylase [Bartonella sp. M0193]MBI0009520.1 lytic murein transglycosylase [Bartonella sp. M0176]